MERPFLLPEDAMPGYTLQSVGPRALARPACTRGHRGNRLERGAERTEAVANYSSLLTERILECTGSCKMKQGKKSKGRPSLTFWRIFISNIFVFFSFQVSI